MANYESRHTGAQIDAGITTANSLAAWAKAPTKPTYTASEVGALPDDTPIPTKTSELQNDSGFLTQHQDISGKVDKVQGKGLSTNDYTTTEKDKLAGIEAGAEVNPTALSELTDDLGNSPTHTHSQYLTQTDYNPVAKTSGMTQAVGKDSDGKLWTTPGGGGGGGAVNSVNGQTGDVILGAEDVGALPDSTVVPTKTSDLENDSGFLTQHQSLSAYRTSADQDTIDAGKASASSVSAIEVRIPAQASAQNQLADKGFVNSSIGTNTAFYISDDGEPFTSVSALEAYSGTVTNNDYAFVTGTDEYGNTFFDRYKASVAGQSITWSKEYRLNNSSFTAAQWAAISSGITSSGVANIGKLKIGNDFYIAQIGTSADAQAGYITFVLE